MKLYDHFYAKIILAHSFMDRFSWKFIWMLISWRHNFFMKFYDLKCLFMLWRSFMIFRPYDLITILTYVLMDNFCPCFNVICVCIYLTWSIYLCVEGPAPAYSAISTSTNPILRKFFPPFSSLRIDTRHLQDSRTPVLALACILHGKLKVSWWQSLFIRW